VGAGFIFARLSNPVVKIIFSNQAIIAPYRDVAGFMFRIINGRSNELIDIGAAVTFSKTERDGRRSLHQLPLERSSVLVFPLNWTIVHPIVKGSPLYGMTGEDLIRAQAEFMVAITATDQDLSRKVYARHSYLYSEVIVGARFKNIIERTGDGTVMVDPARIHEIESADLPK
jgi:inward rectifier potassium channel